MQIKEFIIRNASKNLTTHYSGRTEFNKKPVHEECRGGVPSFIQKNKQQIIEKTALK